MESGHSGALVRRELRMPQLLTWQEQQGLYWPQPSYTGNFYFSPEYVKAPASQLNIKRTDKANCSAQKLPNRRKV